MKLSADVSSELNRASRMPSMRYWAFGLCGAIVPAIYLRSHIPRSRNTAAAGQQQVNQVEPSSESLWQNLSRSYEKVPEQETDMVMFCSIL